MTSPSICFGHETALQILRTTSARERTLLRSGAHTLPDRAPSACAFRQALESLETLHPSMMLELGRLAVSFLAISFQPCIKSSNQYRHLRC